MLFSANVIFLVLLSDMSYFLHWPEFSIHLKSLSIVVTFDYFYMYGANSGFSKLSLFLSGEFSGKEGGRTRE